MVVMLNFTRQEGYCGEDNQALFWQGMNKKFSDFIVFVDESGSSNNSHIDPLYPIFALCFFVCTKEAYTHQINPRLVQFKFKYFGHSEVILHERDIRKDLGEFYFLKTKETKNDFLNELTDLIDEVDGNIICIVIEKSKMTNSPVDEVSLYHLALKLGVRILDRFLSVREGISKTKKIVHIIFEKRGKAEDLSLDLELKKICSGSDLCQSSYEAIFSDKKANSVGIQLADLFARPLGMSVLKPNQINRAVDVANKKLILESGFLGCGAVIVYP
ncbi:MAG: hypothetical protein RIQ84_1492 [Pseudomonadota bacterium]|jgi:Protein of unknown function (DUF3800)